MINAKLQELCKCEHVWSQHWRTKLETLGCSVKGCSCREYSMKRAENACQECGRDNPTWFADSEVWNAVIPDRVCFLCPICFIARAEAVDFKCTGWKLVPENWGSAETGGEKAAPPTCNSRHPKRPLWCDLPVGHGGMCQSSRKAKAPWTNPNSPRSSQNQTVSTGVEGAHEGTTADKSGLLPTQLPKLK